MAHLSIKNIGPIKDIESYRGNPNEPFGAFETTQSDVLEFIDKKKIHCLGYNTLLIATASHIHPPKKQV